MRSPRPSGATAGRPLVIALVFALITVRPSAAQSPSEVDAASGIPPGSVLGAAPSAALGEATSAAKTIEVRHAPTWPALQVSFAALEAMDVITTVRGIKKGLIETNALMRGVAGNPVALEAVKGGAAAATLLLARRMAKRNRPAAVLTMVAVNAAYSVVVARNLATHRR